MLGEQALAYSASFHPQRLAQESADDGFRLGIEPYDRLEWDTEFDRANTRHVSVGTTRGTRSVVALGSDRLRGRFFD